MCHTCISASTTSTEREQAGPGVSKSETIKDAIESTRNSLINHDGYSPEIKVTWPKGQRLTVTEWELHGSYGQGFELLTSEKTRKAIIQRKREYLENAPCPLKIVKKYVRG